MVASLEDEETRVPARGIRVSPPVRVDNRPDSRRAGGACRRRRRGFQASGLDKAYLFTDDVEAGKVGGQDSEENDHEGLGLLDLEDLGNEAQAEEDMESQQAAGYRPVSYTHLTLPTKA